MEIMDNSTSTPILDFAILIYKNIKKLAVINLLIAVLAIVYLFNLDPTYQSTAIISVQSQPGSAGLASMLSEAIPFSMGFGRSSENQKYMGILTTHRVLDVIIKKYNLRSVYNTKTQFETYNAVLGNLGIYDRDDGTFSISYMYENEPAVARDIVQTFYEELTKIALDLNQKVAVNYRSYIEEAYNKMSAELAKAETNFATFQAKTGVLKIGDQISATISTITELELNKVKLELELEYLKKTLDTGSPEVYNKELEIYIIKTKISQLKQGGESFLLSVENLPEQSIDYFRLFREVTVDSKISEFLVLQLQQARIEELKNTGDIYLLDPPQIPDRKIKPKRLTLLIVTMFFSSILSVLWILLREYYIKHRTYIFSR